MFWRLDNKKAVSFPGVCVKLRYVFRKKEKKRFIFAKNSAVYAMPPAERKGYK